MPRGRSTDEQLARRLLTLPIGVVVVDRRYDIATINKAARCLLGIHSPNIGEDVIHWLRACPRPRSAQPSTRRFAVDHPRAQDAVTVSMALGEQRSLHIASYPDRPAGEEAGGGDLDRGDRRDGNGARPARA
jgi:nitrogen fixation/metabolism regulation signal transduction histidine kinase